MTLQKTQIPVFILAGGMGTRLSEETDLKPKPMVEVGGIPLLIHIMRSYYAAGFDDFVICAGYRAWEIKQYFLTYEHRYRHLLVDHRADQGDSVRAFYDESDGQQGAAGQERWRVRVIDTGLETQTGGRVARAFDIASRSSPIECFALTYGDGLCDVNLTAELEFHLGHGEIGTVLGVRPTARFGDLQIEGESRVAAFREKNATYRDFINGGFFFFNAKFREYLTTDVGCILERSPLAKLAEDQNLRTFIHEGFWHPIDTLRDKIAAQKIWDEGRAPWRKD